MAARLREYRAKEWTSVGENVKMAKALAERETEKAGTGRENRGVAGFWCKKKERKRQRREPQENDYAL